MRRTRSAASKAARREEILDAASRIFAKLGYTEAEMEQIASRIHVAKGTLYLYFESKRELFFACVDEGLKQLQIQVLAATEGVDEPFAKITAGIRAFLVFFDAHPHVVELFIQERASFKDRKRPAYFIHRDVNRIPWKALYQGLADAGKIRADIPVEHLLDAIGNLLYGAMFTNRMNGRKITVEEQADQLTKFVFQGLKSRD